MAANKTDNNKPIERHTAKGAYAMVIIPVLIFGFGFAIYVDSSSSDGAATTSASPERMRSTVPVDRVNNPGIPDDVCNAPESEEQLFFDDGVKEIRLDVPVGDWSAEVVTPQGSRNYRCDVKPDKTVFYVKFADGHIEKIGGGEKRFKDVKIRRGIMRFYGTVPGQKVTVTIE